MIKKISANRKDPPIQYQMNQIGPTFIPQNAFEIF